MPTNTPAQAFPVPVDGDDPNIPGDLLALASAIEKRVIGIYATTAARDTATTAASLTEGCFAYTLADHKLWLRGASAWAEFPTRTPAITNGTAAPTGGVDNDVYFRI